MREKITGNMLHSFKIKIAAVFFVFVSLSLSVFGLFLYKEFRSELKREMQESMKNRLENVSYNLEVLLETVKMNTTMLSLDRNIISIVSDGQSGSAYENLNQISEVKEELLDSLNTHEILKSIYLISVKEPFFFRTDMQYTYDFEKVSRQEWRKAIQGVEKNQYLLLPRDTLTESQPEDTLSYVVPVKNRTGTQITGYLLANVGYKTVDNYFQNNRIGSEGEIFVYDEEKIIYSSNQDAEFAGKIIDSIEFGKNQGQITVDDFLITYKWSKEMNWMYVAKIPLSEVMAPAGNIGRWAVGLLLISIPLIIMGAVLLSYAIFSPVKVLVKSMERVGDGRYIKIEQQRKDEFGKVFMNFNTMTDKIFLLMDDLCRQETLTKELEIKNLQAQLSPHFLYNTLDAIHWAARDEDMDAVCQMTFLLSNYFRKNLSSGKERMSVQEVADMIKSYMDIQVLRFMDGFSYTLEVDPEIAYEKVPKHLFQPIVENALCHGIERSSKEGKCMIAWTKAEKKIRFFVKDNGRGMSESELKNLQYSIEREKSDAGENFALHNIQMQLKLYYGEKIHIISELGKGTEVSFFLAIEQEDKDV